ncbi:MAG: endonuclease III [Gemmatimonadetes bacterium]|nr:endonuclease III [Gemmatimonadota bacterium]
MTRKRAVRNERRTRTAGRESQQARRARAPKVFELLAGAHPDAQCALTHKNPYQLIVAVILSAQCTDERVNQVTPSLFRRYPTVADLAAANQQELEELIRPTGFFRNKTKSLLGMAGAVMERHDGRIPNTMEELIQLPGVGRKTANVILGVAFGKNEGVVVDTHVHRLARRLAFTKHDDPAKIEQDLMELFPRERWTDLGHLLIFHGRRVCNARKPRCAECVVSRLCPSSSV